MFNTSLQSLTNSKSLLSSLDVISNSENKSISVIPFGSVHDMNKVITQKTYSNRVASKLVSKKNITIYKLECFESNSGNLRDSGDFLLYKDPNYEYTYLIITLDSSEFFHRELRPFLRAFYSEVILPFIKSTELITLIENYKTRSSATDIKITMASQRIRYHDEKTMSTLTWNNSNLEDAYTWLIENNGWFKSLQFRALQSDHEISKTFIDRRGIVRTERNFINVYDTLIKPTCNLIEHYIRLFRNRGRRDNANLDIKPLSIEYSQDIFTDKQQNKNFIEALSSLKEASVSVLHGNPYIHLSIIDYNDASTFDLWVLSENRILITPQLRCSIISLKRLVNHIFDYYAEGEIKNYEA